MVTHSHTASATSSGVTSRPFGCFCCQDGTGLVHGAAGPSRDAGHGRVRHRRVDVARTDGVDRDAACWPARRPRTRTTPRMPCLLAVYAATYGSPTLAEIDATTTMRPWPRSSMPGMAAGGTGRAPSGSGRASLPLFVRGLGQRRRGARPRHWRRGRRRRPRRPRRRRTPGRWPRSRRCPPGAPGSAPGTASAVCAQLVLAARGQRDAVALRAEPDGHGSPDPASGTGDQRHRNSWWFPRPCGDSPPRRVPGARSTHPPDQAGRGGSGRTGIPLRLRQRQGGGGSCSSRTTA